MPTRQVSACLTILIPGDVGLSVPFALGVTVLGAGQCELLFGRAAGAFSPGNNAMTVTVPDRAGGAPGEPAGSP
jgi:hypothetical protein